MNEKDFRIILWLADGVLVILATLMWFGRQALKGVPLTYENQDALHDVWLWLMLANLVVWVVGGFLTVALLIWSWSLHKTLFKQWLEHALQKIAQVALDMAAKLSPKPAKTQARQQPKPPPAPSKPDPEPPSDPPKPPPPLWPPYQGPDLTYPPPLPPSDPTPVPSGPGPDLDPNSGGAALPVPQEPIRRMVSNPLVAA